MSENTTKTVYVVEFRDECNEMGSSLARFYDRALADYFVRGQRANHPEDPCEVRAEEVPVRIVKRWEREGMIWT